MKRQEPKPLAYEREVSFGRIRVEGWNKQTFIPTGKKNKKGKDIMMPVRHRYVIVRWELEDGSQQSRRFWLTYRGGRLVSISDSHRKGTKTPTVTLDLMREEIARILRDDYKASDIVAHVTGELVAA